MDSLSTTVRGLLSAHGPAAPAAKATYVPGDYSIHFFLQLAIIIFACRLFGWLGRRLLSQPQVVGEMIAGVLLGPSLLGLIWPEAQAALFPKETRNVLYVGAQLGVGLYMFLMGTSLEVDHLRAKARSAIGVSAAGIVVPFAFAIILAPWLLTIPGLFAPTIGQLDAILFIGACIALTAFPMLARIIDERGLAGTPLGTLALTAGAFDDVCSWAILAIVLATFGGGPGVAVLAIGGGLLYAAFLFVFGRRLLAPLGDAVEQDGGMSGTVVAIALITFCLSAFYTEAIGIHAIFGGFIIGVAMPRGRFGEELRRKLEPLVGAMLVPMFFVYSGLNTQLTLVNSPKLLLVAVAVLGVSIAGKFGACYLAARIAGEENRVALGIGALMNARGLMELIIINIGLQKGIIGPGMFAMLVLMAIITTVMATPLFERVYGRAPGRARTGDEPAPAPQR